MRLLAFTLAASVALWCLGLTGSVAKAETCPLTAERLLRQSEMEIDLSLRERLIRKAIKACPDDPKPYLYLGRHFERSGKPGDRLILQAYQEALRRIPMAKENFRKAAGSNGDHAPETVGKLVSPFPPEPAFKNGEVFPGGSLEGLMARAPNNPDERRNLAEVLTHLGEERIRNNQSGGKVLLVRALELAPGYERPRRSLFRSFQQLGNFQFRGSHFEKAIDLYKEALKYLPNDPKVLKRIADAYYAMGGHEKDQLAYLERTVSALENGRPARARVAKAEAVAQGKRAWEVGKSLLAAADYVNASRAFKVAVAWMPDNALVHFDLATVLTKLDGSLNPKAALTHFELAQRLFRENPPPEAEHLKAHFQRRLRIEIDYLTGKTNPWGYLLSRTSQSVREKALEFSLFFLFLVGVSGYLLRVGYKLKENTKA